MAPIAKVRYESLAVCIALISVHRYLVLICSRLFPCTRCIGCVLALISLRKSPCMT
jgi:hypothetical protein